MNTQIYALDNFFFQIECFVEFSIDGAIAPSIPIQVARK